MQVEQRSRHQLGDAPALVGKATPPASSGRSNAPLTSWSERIGQQRPDQPLEVSRVRVRRVAVEKADDVAAGDVERAPHRVALAERRPVLGQYLVLLDHPGAGRPPDLRGSVGRVGVDDQHVVDQPGLAQRTHGAREDAGQRVRALLGRDHHRHRRRPLLGAQPLRRERARHVAPLGRPRRHGEVDRQSPRRPAVGAGGGADADVVGAEDRNAGLRQPLGERGVLERGQRLEAADRAVHAGGDPDRSAGEVVVGSGRIGPADPLEAMRGVALAPAQHLRRQAS